MTTHEIDIQNYGMRTLDCLSGEKRKERWTGGCESSPSFAVRRDARRDDETEGKREGEGEERGK